MTTGRINQVSTSARAPRTITEVIERECGWVSASSGGTVNSRRQSRFHPGPRPNLGLDHSSPGETAPADELAITNSDRSTAAFGARIQKDSRASTPRTVGVIPPDTHTSSLHLARAGKTDDGHVETPRTRRPARHDRTRTAPRPRGKRQ